MNDSHARPSLVLALALAFASAAVCARAQAPVIAKRSPIVLLEGVRSDGLPAIISGNYSGLADEAARVDAWMKGGEGANILKTADLALQDATGRRLSVSAPMAAILERLNDWYALTAPPDHPITHDQLRAAVLTPSSLERIQALFEHSIGRAVRVDDKWVIPETGGEATIDSELRFFEVADPRWATVRDLAMMAGDPASIGSLCLKRALEVADVDSHGLIRNAVGRFNLGMNGARNEVRRAVDTVIQNAAPTYTHDPDLQFALVASRNWSGRYVGQWHSHAPHQGKDGWIGGDVPSFEDMQNAVAAGQYLTLSFQPDGFDLYDAEPLADARRVDLSLVKVIHYRSVVWREHFQELKQKLETSR